MKKRTALKKEKSACVGGEEWLKRELANKKQRQTDRDRRR